MASKGQLTGMRGVYLVAAELTRLGFVVSATSRSGAGADLLVTNQTCSRSFSVQVKSNARTFSFWLVDSGASKRVARSHVYVFVNLRPGVEPEYYVVPSKTVAAHVYKSKSSKGDVWRSVALKAIASYQDRWTVFGKPEG